MSINKLQAKIKQYQENHLLRERQIVEARSEQHLQLANKTYLNFSSNDYLGLSQHPLVKEAFIKGVQKFGLGSTAANIVSGYHNAHYELEEHMADFLGTEAVVLFSSGYMANLAAITTLCARHDRVLSDRHCHASLLDGIQLSRSRHYRFRHQDLTHLTNYLKASTADTTIVTESVFSMSGDITPIHELTSIANQFHSQLIVDDAHAFGVLGEYGRGILEAQKIPADKLTCLITPFGKALGSMGAVISGNKNVIAYLIQFANTYRYTTAMPPAISYATLQSLKLLANETWRRQRLNTRIQYFNQQAKIYNLPLISYDCTPIRSILLGENRIALHIQQALRKDQHYVTCIRPPTVPAGTARLRICLNVHHEKQDIDSLIQKIVFYQSAWRASHVK